MEIQATKHSFAHKALVALMAIVFTLALSAMLSVAPSTAYADDSDVSAAQVGAQADLPDGTYLVTGLESSLGMFHFDADSVSVRIEGEQAWLNVNVVEDKTIKRYSGMAYGKASAIVDPADETNCTLVEGSPVATVNDITDDAGAVSIRMFSLPIEKSVLLSGDEIDYTLQYSEGYDDKHSGDWYKGSKDYYFKSGYAIWSDELEVANHVKMFNVSGAQLSADGAQVRIAMGTDSFDKVALCKAAKADDEEQYAITDQLVTIPASELGDGERITTSWWSVSREAWYERDITFDAQAKTLTFDVTVNAVEEIDKLGTIEAVRAAIADGSLVVTPGLVDDMIAAIQVQVRDEKTDFYCEAAKVLWDALSDAGKELVDEADYFARDTGDASKDDPLNADGIGENEILVVSFGTSFNNSRVAAVGGVEKAIQAAFPGWSVRRAFTAQIIINHVQSRDGEKIDNMDQALERAVANGVKNLIVAPTHLMHGAEYDELVEALAPYQDKMSIVISEPLLGQKSDDPSALNADKETVAKAVVAAAVKDAGYESLEKADAAGTAFVFMGHGTAHEANITYTQMQKQMEELGYKNVFIGTVEGEPEDTECSVVIEKVKAAGYKNVVLRPLMVVAGDHANNDMADPEDEESWLSQFTASGAFEKIDCQIQGLGELPEVQQVYVEHVKAVVPTTAIAVPTAAQGLTYTGAEQAGVEAGEGYTLSGTTSATDAGAYEATAKLADGYVWEDGTDSDKVIAWSIAKADAKADVTKAKKYKATALKKKAKSFQAIKLTTDGKATWKVTKNSNKKVVSFKAGKVTVKKGAAKGKYTLKVKASAKAGTNYKALAAKAYTITVTVK